METGKMINRISHRLRRRLANIQDAAGLGGAQGAILDYILVETENRNVYQKDIEKEFELRPPTATQALKGLEEKGMIRRVAEQDDGRRKRILFTEKAEQMREILRREIVMSEQVLLQGISSEEKRQFLETAAKMLDNLDEDSRQKAEEKQKMQEEHSDGTGGRA